MTDPAVEAAKRAWVNYCENGPPDDVEPGSPGTMNDLMRATAREALKPLQELHYPFPVRSLDGEQWTECASCAGSEWPCETAKLIYREDEL